MAKTHQLRSQLFPVDEAALGEHARDTQKILAKIPVVEHRITEQLYSEPLTLGQLTEEPFSIELVRVLNLFSPTTPVLTGGMCHFTWLPQAGGAVIASIDGMSPGRDGATKFRFYFRVTFKME